MSRGDRGAHRTGYVFGDPHIATCSERPQLLYPRVRWGLSPQTPTNQSQNLNTGVRIDSNLCAKTAPTACLPFGVDTLIQEDRRRTSTWTQMT